MSLELWLAFVAASAILLAIPGPTILIVVSYALGHGRRAALSTVAGVALGDFTAMTCSMLGLGALLATSAMLFTALKWLGAAYLVWLGIKLWRAPPTLGAAGAEGEAGAAPELRPWRMFGHAYVVTALNPKSLVFFVAFLPQFLDLSAPARPADDRAGGDFRDTGGPERPRLRARRLRRPHPDPPPVGAEGGEPGGRHAADRGGRGGRDVAGRVVNGRPEMAGRI